MNLADYAVIAVYLAGVLGLGYWLSGQDSGQEYFLGNRSFGWLPLGLSVAATQLSSASFISAPAFVGMKEGGGMVWLSYELALPLAMLLLMTLLFPTLYRAGVISIYAFLEARFGASTRLLLSLVFQLSRAFATSVMVYAVALILTHALGMSLWLTILTIGVVTVIYSYQGGMKAVVYGDAVQMVLLLLGLLLCLTIGLQQLGGWAVLAEQVDPARLQAVNFADWGFGQDSGFGFWPMLVGGLFLYMAYYGTDQSQAQRLLAARDLKTLRRVLLANGLIRFPVTLCYCIMGLVLGTLAMTDPEFGAAIPTGEPDLLVPVFIRDRLPVGLTGLLIVAIFSAAMSSVSSAINSLSAASVEDFYARGRSLTPRQYMRASQIASLGWGGLCIGLAFFTGNIAGTIIEAINKIGSLFFGPILATFVAAILLPRITGRGVNAGIVAGVLTNTLLWLAVPQLFWFWWNVTGFAACLGIAWVVSLFGSAPALVASTGWRPEIEPRSSVILLLYFFAITLLCIALPALLQA